MDKVEALFSAAEKQVAYCLYRMLLTGETITFMEAGPNYMWLREEIIEALKNDLVDVQVYKDLHEMILSGDTIAIENQTEETALALCDRLAFKPVREYYEVAYSDPYKIAKYWCEYARIIVENEPFYFSTMFDILTQILYWIDDRTYKIKSLNTTSRVCLVQPPNITNPLTDCALWLMVFDASNIVSKVESEELYDILFSLPPDEEKIDRVENFHAYFELYKNSSRDFTNLTNVLIGDGDYMDKYLSVVRPYFHSNTTGRIIQAFPPIIKQFPPMIKPVLSDDQQLHFLDFVTSLDFDAPKKQIVGFVFSKKCTERELILERYKLSQTIQY